MDPFSYILTLLPARAALPALAVVGLCAMLDAILPQPREGSRWVLPRKVVTTIGANWLYARNLSQVRGVAGAATHGDAVAAGTNESHPASGTGAAR